MDYSKKTFGKVNLFWVRALPAWPASLPPPDSSSRFFVWFSTSGRQSIGKPFPLMTDSDLLHRFCAQGDESAFRELTLRHAGLIYHTALRRTGDPEVACEITQTVFCLLAQKARALRGGGSLAGWLHRVATLQARNAVRKESRRLRVMTALQQMPSLLTPAEPQPPDSAWPHIDEALEGLSQRDRDVIMAHYYQDLTYQEIAVQRRESEAAVQRRASRAIEKLGASLRRRGGAVSSAGLAAGLSAVMQQTAPAGILPALLPAALLPAAAIPSKSLGFSFSNAALLILAAGLSASLTFGITRAHDTETAKANHRAGTLKTGGSYGPLDELKSLSIESHPPGDWRSLVAGAADVLRSATDRHAESRVAWMLAPLKTGEYPFALNWIAELPRDDKVRDSLAGIVLCLWGERDPQSAWAAFASFSPAGEHHQEDFIRYGSVLFLKRWDAAPLQCIAALSSKDDSRQAAAQEAMVKILASESELARWREVVGKTPSDEARASGAILALSRRESVEPWNSFLPWIFELHFQDEGQRKKVLSALVDYAATWEEVGDTVSGWLEHLPEESAATVLPVMQRAMLEASEEVRLKLSKVIKRPELLKSLQESL